MLRLWPEEVQIGLFGEHCWLVRGRAKVVREHAAALASDGAAKVSPLDTLAAILDDPENGVRPGSRVSLTVSDALASILALPWQEALQSPEECQRYARLLFEKDGRDIDADAVMRADFASYGAPGLAYAFPRAWMVALLHVVNERGLRLLRVLPASAAAYYLPQRGARGGLRMFLLQESGRVSALQFNAGQFAGVDVEPAIGAGDEAMLRLLRRAFAAHGKARTIVHWSAQPDGQAALLPVLSIEAPEASVIALAREALR